MLKLALVSDAPHDQSKITEAYVERLIQGCYDAGAGQALIETFYAVQEMQPGGKAPAIGVVREARPELLERLVAWGPDMILSMGSAALNGVGGGAKAMVLKKERGRMRWLDICDEDGMCHMRTPWLPTIAPVHVVRNMDLHRDFAADLWKALTQREPMDPMVIDSIVCHSAEELRNAVELLEGATVMGVDVETTGLSQYDDELLSVGLGVLYTAEDGKPAGLSVVAPAEILGEAEVVDILWDTIWRKDRRAVGHNFKFDMQFTAPLIGWAPDGALVGDTLLLGHLLDERPTRHNTKARGASLKDYVATRYDHEYGFDFKGFYELEDGEEREGRLREMELYLGEDVCYTARLWMDMEREAREESPALWAAHDATVMPAAKAIARAEFAGAPVDIEWVQETVATIEARMAVARAQLEADLAVLAPTQVITNIMAPMQIADLVYGEWGWTPDLRKNGRLMLDDRSTDKDHLQAAISKYSKSKNPLEQRRAEWTERLVQLRKDDKLATTYKGSILGKVNGDGRIRAGFMLHGTSTGRLSSSGPNLQNIPAIDREGAEQELPMRRAFKPRDGRLWVEVDYSQLELRVAAAISGDKAMGDIFRGGRDVHMEMASAIFSKPPEEIAKAERFLAKAVSFGIIYGRSAKALAGGKEMEYAKQKLGMTPWTEPVAQAFIDKFLRSYPDLTDWMDRIHRDTPVLGYVESPFGRRRRFPLITKRERESIERQAVNTPIQSAASDICLMAMVEITRRIEATGLDAVVLFPVHDSICIEVAPEAVPELEALCRDVMEIEFMGVPLKVDFEFGPSWAETH